MISVFSVRVKVGASVWFGVETPRPKSGIPLENILYLGGPNIASEVYNKEYANARICGSEKWRKPLGKFLRQSHFIVWDNSDLVTHEPEKLAGPLLADTYVTLLKGRNAWYGQKLAKGELNLQMGDSIKGKGMIQGVSAVKAFFELLNQSSLSLQHPEEDKPVTPAELCPILKMLYRILITREVSCEAVLEALRDETMNDPRELIEIAHSHLFFQPSLLGQTP
ncbi:hypothetical protein F2Q70_00023798 [Brassica cretica]|nr:hypothetical protein F2Q70_00023798 [Brassica cretica]